MSLTERLTEYIRACFTRLCIQSHEHEDALAEIAQLCHEQDWPLVIWDLAQGSLKNPMPAPAIPSLPSAQSKP
jgi:hypothetical protein